MNSEVLTPRVVNKERSAFIARATYEVEPLDDKSGELLRSDVAKLKPKVLDGQLQLVSLTGAFNQRKGGVIKAKRQVKRLVLRNRENKTTRFGGLERVCAEKVSGR